jgi:hypothetical protein
MDVCGNVSDRTLRNETGSIRMRHCTGSLLFSGVRMLYGIVPCSFVIDMSNIVCDGNLPR